MCSSERDSFAGSGSAGESACAEHQTAGSRSGVAKAVIIVTPWHDEPIHKNHDSEAFDSGDEALREFSRRYARRSHELGGAKTFLAIDDADNKSLLGFNSLGSASVDYAQTPEIIRRGLAVDRGLQGQGIGGQLLLAAGRRCLLASAEVGGASTPRMRE